MNSYVGLVIQCVGIGLVTLLSFFMMRSIRGTSQRYWAVAWSCLSVALSSLMVAFHAEGGQNLFYTIYLLGEYAFGYMFVAGCRHHTSGARLSHRDLVALAVAAPLAVSLPLLFEDFNDLFMLHASFMACLFAAGYLALRPARGAAVSPGQRVMSVAFVLLALDFLHYLPVFGARDGAWASPCRAATCNTPRSSTCCWRRCSASGR